MSSLDHQQKALSRVYAQYRDKPKFVEWMGIVGLLSNQLETAYCDIAQSYDIESAESAELDVIGRIVVLSRYLDVLFPLPGPGGTGSQKLSDQAYRILIKAKIGKNVGDATIDGIIETLSFVIPDAGIRLDDVENMSFSVSINRLFSADEFLVLKNFDFVGKPQGVNFLGFAVIPMLVCLGDPWAQCGDPRAICTPLFI